MVKVHLVDSFAIPLCFLCCILCGNSFGSDEQPLFSGPQPGERLASFELQDVLGEQPQELFDPMEAAGENPVLLVFFHQRTRPAFGLMNTITRYAATRAADGLHTSIIVLADDPTSTADWIRRVKRNFAEGIFVGLSPNGKEGPGVYGLNRSVALTVLVGKQRRVTANFATAQPSVQVDGPQILKAIVEVLGGGEVPDIANFSNRGANSERAMRPLPEKTREHLRSLTSGQMDEQRVDKLVVEVEKLMAEHPTLRQQLVDAVSTITRSANFKERMQPKFGKKLDEWTREFSRNRSPARDDSPQDANLRGLLGPVIRKAATPDEVKQAAAKVEQCCAENPAARTQVGAIARRIIDAGRLRQYGTAQAQEFLEKWAEQFRAD